MDFDSKCLRILGGLSISIVGLQIIRNVLPWLYVNLIGPRLFGARVKLSKLGEWAVVTGATDGIGKAYALLLAKQGINVVLISRSKEKLENVAKEIVDSSKVEVKTIDVDFTDGPEIFDKIKNVIKDLDIGVLVNNVGISYPYPEFFLECVEKNPKFLRDIISANIHSVTHMCAMVLPKMVEKGKGAIINLSSTAAVIPNPLLTVYSATKAFVDKFSVDLLTEYKKKGIIIQSVQPGFVATNMTKIRKPTLFAPSAKTYVQSALNTLGYAPQTAGYFPHAIMQMGIRVISAVTCEPYARDLVFNSLLKTRQRALRNLAKEK